MTAIGPSAFDTCSALTSIEIPKSVTYIGYLAFVDCSGLETVYFTGTKNEWAKIDINDAFGTDEHLRNATLICTGTDDDSGLIYEDNGDGTSNIIGYGTIITIPEETPNGETITRIASYSFNNLQNLIIEIPSTMQIIEDYAFYSCSIKEIRYSGTVEEWYNIIKTDGLWNANSSGFTVICSDGEITY